MMLFRYSTIHSFQYYILPATKACGRNVSSNNRSFKALAAYDDILTNTNQQLSIIQ